MSVNCPARGCILPFIVCGPIETAVAPSAFVSSCYPQAGTKNFRYLSFPYSNPQAARREARAAESTGNPCLPVFPPVQGQMVEIWGLQGQEVQSRLLCRYSDEKKMIASFMSKFQSFIYGHRNLTLSQFCHAPLFCFKFPSHLEYIDD